MSKKFLTLFLMCGMITAMTACGEKPAEESSEIEIAETEAEITTVPEEEEPEVTTTEEELVEPDYPVIVPDENAITFNDGDDLFTAHCMAQKNFENDESNCKLSIAEYKGERQLKIEVLDYDDEKYMYKTPKIVFDIDQLVGIDNQSKIKSFSCDITQVAAGMFKGDDGEEIFVPGNLMGTFGSNVGEDAEWYQPTGSSNEYAQAEWNFEWEYLHVEGKWLLKGFADGCEGSALVFMRWSIPNQADIYIDNLTFYDEDGNSIPIVYTPGSSDDTETEASDEETETSETETEAEETESSDDESDE